jgi:hypothetical protein
MKEPHPQAGSRKKSTLAGHLTRACAGPGCLGRHK